MDRLESMSTLVAAVEAGSLSAAARRLGMPLATVSRKVSELELHLGTQLLHRSSRKLSLTDAGRSYLAACTRILEQIGEAERAASGEYSAPRGDLVLSAPIVFGRLHVLPIVTEFLRVYPEIDVRIVFSDRLANLFEEHVDVAIRVGALPDSSLIATRLGAIRRCVCGSPGYFERRGIPKQPPDLSHHDCITFEGISSADSWLFEGKRRGQSVQIRSRLIVNTAEAAIDAARLGLGVTRVFSYQFADSERNGALQRVLKSFEPAPLPVHLLHTAQPLLPLKLRVFLDYAAPRLKAQLSAHTPLDGGAKAKDNRRA
ncbi:MAG: LysR family transcriptional regulator [Myxococcales bacterium]|jgi:DNA-binding transcriptional LysR family regulator